MSATTVAIPAPRTASAVWVDRNPGYAGLDFGDSSSDSLYEND